MNISGLIKELTEIRDEFGDLEIRADSDPYELAVSDTYPADILMEIVEDENDKPESLTMNIFAGGDPRHLL